MKTTVPSVTAERVAFARAVESRRKERDRVCVDPLAEHFVSPKLKLILNSLFLRTGLRLRGGRVRPGLIDYVVARTRYMDDYLKTCVNDGIEQLVILGAGYDARAYRIPNLAVGIKIFEVDHPATQEMKLQKLKEMSPNLTANVTYVTTDFEQGDFEQELIKNGYKASLKTLFIWEGVTYYLTDRTVHETLKFVAASSGPGSSIIFDYVSVEVVRGLGMSRIAFEFLSRLERSGESLIFGIDPVLVEDFLRQRGFCNVHNVSSPHLKSLYFTGSNRRRPISEIFWIAHATVDPSGREPKAPATEI